MQRGQVRLLAGSAIAVLAFAAGYWPQHQKYLSALEEMRAADKQMLAALASQRIYYLENMMLQVLDLTAHKDYNEAHELTMQFFIEVRACIARPDMAQYSKELQTILDQSDAIENSVRKQDPPARDMIRGVMKELANIATPPPESNPPPPILPVPPKPQS